MSRDLPPLIFARKLGALRPVTKAAEDALAALGVDAPVTITIKKARPNQRRMALYWLCAAVTAENWPMKAGRMTERMLHRQTKEVLGIGGWIETASGVKIFDADSIGFAEMTEDQRSAYINAAFALWSTRPGVDVQVLLDEARQGQPSNPEPPSREAADAANMTPGRGRRQMADDEGSKQIC